VILIDGRVRADGSLQELTRSKVQVVTLAADDAGRTRQLFEGLGNVAAVEDREAEDGFRTYRLKLREDREIGEFVAEIVRANGWRMRELRRDDRSLEQVFRELTETAVEARA
jgi:ABC-type multidrug transport system ATPase subunit